MIGISISAYDKLRERRRSRRKQLTQALDELVRKLKDMGAKKIIVFGSYASGEVNRWSDLDVLVIMPSSKNGKEWFKKIYDEIDVDAPADILPFTEEEFKAKLKTSSFIRYALKTGRVVYEKR